jgi:hypothetical protein
MFSILSRFSEAITSRSIPPPNNESAQKDMAFDKMCRGWALGTKEFKKSLLTEAEDNRDNVESKIEIARYDGKSLREANELRCEILLERGLRELGKDAQSILADKKSAEWKVTLATVMKQKTSATSVWIAGKLNMGAADGVSRYVSTFKMRGGGQSKRFIELTTNMMT